MQTQRKLYGTLLIFLREIKWWCDPDEIRSCHLEEGKKRRPECFKYSIFITKEHLSHWDSLFSGRKMFILIFKVWHSLLELGRLQFPNCTSSHKSFLYWVNLSHCLRNQVSWLSSELAHVMMVRGQPETEFSVLSVSAEKQI